jgi:taurine dioxygenase
MRYRTIEVHPLGGALGAEVFGADLSQDLDNETFADIHQALLDHLVIFFRDQQLTPERQLAFARRFGSLNIHRYVKGMDAHLELMLIVKERHETKRATIDGDRSF